MYIQIKIIKKMFNLFGKKNKKKAPIDLNVESQNMSNSMNDIVLKIDQVDKQVKAQHQIYKTALNPIIKEEENE